MVKLIKKADNFIIYKYYGFLVRVLFSLIKGEIILTFESQHEIIISKKVIMLLIKNMGIFHHRWEYSLHCFDYSLHGIIINSKQSIRFVNIYDILFDYRFQVNAPSIMFKDVSYGIFIEKANQIKLINSNISTTFDNINSIIKTNENKNNIINLYDTFGKTKASKYNIIFDFDYNKLCLKLRNEHLVDFNSHKFNFVEVCIKNDILLKNFQNIKELKLNKINYIHIVEVKNDYKFNKSDFYKSVTCEAEYDEYGYQICNTYKTYNEEPEALAPAKSSLCEDESKGKTSCLKKINPLKPKITLMNRNEVEKYGICWLSSSGSIIINTNIFSQLFNQIFITQIDHKDLDYCETYHTYEIFLFK